MNKKYDLDGKIMKIISGPAWDGAVSLHSARKAIEVNEMSLAKLSHLDELLSGLLSADISKNIEDNVSDITRDWPLWKVRFVRQALHYFFEESPTGRVIDAIAAHKSRNERPPRRKENTARQRRFSVAPEDLPSAWQDALQSMRNGHPGIGAAAPVPSMVITMRTKLTELVRAARDASLSDVMSIESCIAYERSLLTRESPLSPVTIHSALRQIRDFAKYIGLDQPVIDHLCERTRIHEGRANRAEPQKESKILLLPSYREIFEMALCDLNEAERTPHPRIAQRLRNTAVAITLFCPFPLRVSNTRLRFGREIIWNNGYHFNLTIHKTLRTFSSPILPSFAFFIDQMVLQGSSIEHLDDLREQCFRETRALFVKHDGREPHGNYVSYLWRRKLGTGCHAARTKLHDEFGRLGARGVELAMRACDHRSEKTAEYYRTREFDRASIARVHQVADEEITDAEWLEFFGAPKMECQC